MLAATVGVSSDRNGGVDHNDDNSLQGDLVTGKKEKKAIILDANSLSCAELSRKKKYKI